MLRSVLGVIVGFIAWAAILFVGLAVAWFVLGEDRALVSGGYDITTTWTVVMLAMWLIAGFLGGALGKMVARSPKGPMALVVVLLVLGGVMAVVEVTKEVPPDPPVRTPPTAMTDAMQNAKQPLWVTIANPILGAIGVLVGAGIIKGREGAAG